MGATRGRLISQLLTESLLLAFLGGALAIPVAYWGLRLLPGPPGQATLLDWRVLGFILIVTGLTGLVFGIAPALRATRVSLNASMKDQSRSVIGTRSIVARILLIVQVAVYVQNGQGSTYFVMFDSSASRSASGSRSGPAVSWRACCLG